MAPTMYYEDGEGELLTTVRLASDKRLTTEEFLDRLSTGYADHRSAGSGSPASYREHAYLLLTLGQHAEARKVGREAVTVLPHHWWPRLAVALMDPTGDEGDGFADWVRANPSLSHYVYLCYYLDAVGRGDAA